MSAYEHAVREQFSIVIRDRFVRVEIYVDGKFVGYRWTERAA